MCGWGSGRGQCGGGGARAGRGRPRVGLVCDAPGAPRGAGQAGTSQCTMDWMPGGAEREREREGGLRLQRSCAVCAKPVWVHRVGSVLQSRRPASPQALRQVACFIISLSRCLFLLSLCVCRARACGIPAPPPTPRQPANPEPAPTPQQTPTLREPHLMDTHAGRQATFHHAAGPCPPSQTMTRLRLPCHKGRSHAPPWGATTPCPHPGPRESPTSRPPRTLPARPCSPLRAGSVPTPPVRCACACCDTYQQRPELVATHRQGRRRHRPLPPPRAASRGSR